MLLSFSLARNRLECEHDVVVERKCARIVDTTNLVDFGEIAVRTVVGIKLHV